jgi:hypothetical protein
MKVAAALSKMLFEPGGWSIVIKSIRPAVRRFHPCEDRALEDAVRRLGTASWEAIAAHVPARTARQCRERWIHHLSMGQRGSPWTPAEDDLLWDRVAEMGPKWGRIALMLQGKSDYQAKARWMTLFRGCRRNCFRSGCQRHIFAIHKRHPDMTHENAEMEDAASIWDHIALHMEQQWRDEDGVEVAGQWW